MTSKLSDLLTVKKSLASQRKNMLLKIRKIESTRQELIILNRSIYSAMTDPMLNRSLHWLKVELNNLYIAYSKIIASCHNAHMAHFDEVKAEYARKLALKERQENALLKVNGYHVTVYDEGELLLSIPKSRFDLVGKGEDFPVYMRLKDLKLMIELVEKTLK